MKLILCVFALLVATIAGLKINWPKTLPGDINISTDNRIVGGEQVEPHSLPYQAAIWIKKNQNKKGSYCGGSLISQRYVLTVAHCLRNALEIQVVLGAHNLSKEEPTQVRLTPEKYITHPEYDSELSENDVALIKLPREVELTKEIQVISLPSYSNASKTCWGRSIALPYGIGGHGPCGGDSGGPLVIGNKQVGIAVFKHVAGCEKGYPSGYARVSSYLDWIKENSDVEIKD